MNTESEKQKLRWFISCLVVIALVINSICFEIKVAYKNSQRRQWQQEQAQLQIQQQQAQQALIQQGERERRRQLEREKEAAALKAAQDAAAEHARYLARYLNSGFSRKSGGETVAVAAASEDGAFNQTVTRALASHLNTNGVKMLSAFFKPAFVSDGLINSGFDDASDLSSKLELTNSLDALLLARQSVEYSSNPSLENVLTASMKLDVVAVSIVGNIKSQVWTFTAVGTGFKNADARAMAEERLIKQINADTKISLNQISLNNSNQ